MPYSAINMDVADVVTAPTLGVYTWVCSVLYTVNLEPEHIEFA